MLFSLINYLLSRIEWLNYVNVFLRVKGKQNVTFFMNIIWVMIDFMVERLFKHKIFFAEISPKSSFGPTVPLGCYNVVVVVFFSN